MDQVPELALRSSTRIKILLVSFSYWNIYPYSQDLSNKSESEQRGSFSVGTRIYSDKLQKGGGTDDCLHNWYPSNKSEF